MKLVYFIEMNSMRLCQFVCIHLSVEYVLNRNAERDSAPIETLNWE